MGRVILRWVRGVRYSTVSWANRLRASCATAESTGRWGGSVAARRFHEGPPAFQPRPRTKLLQSAFGRSLALAKLRDIPEDSSPCAPISKIGRASCRERVCQYV